MKNIIRIASFIVLTVLLFSTTMGVSAKDMDQDRSKCSKDPNAPCYIVINQTITPLHSLSWTNSIMSSSYVGTCGVTVYNQYNVALASLSQQTTATWNYGNVNIDNVSHSTWVANFLYSWENLMDESYFYGQSSESKTYGDLHYMGYIWRRYLISQLVFGNTEGGFICTVTRLV